MAKIKMVGSVLPALDMRTVKQRPKEAAEHYRTPEHAAWRLSVMRKARWQCQHPGCTRGYPQHRLHADHINEILDGGAALDPANGQALCDEHHGQKTAEARRLRMSRMVSPHKRAPT